jgi:hypothetical protein
VTKSEDNLRDRVRCDEPAAHAEDEPSDTSGTHTAQALAAGLKSLAEKGLIVELDGKLVATDLGHAMTSKRLRRQH